MLALVSTAKEVRAAGLRAFRHLFSDEKTLSKILDFRIDIFVVRCSLISIHLNLICFFLTLFSKQQQLVYVTCSATL